jgi:flagellar biogenesis protein FliO
VAAALESYVTESVAILLVAVLLVALVSLAARRAGFARPLGPIELLARLPIEPRRAVYVVRVVDRLLIIGSSEAGLVKLGELPKGALPARSSAPESSFASLLDGVWRSSGRGPRTASGELDEGEREMPSRSGPPA